MPTKKEYRKQGRYDGVGPKRGVVRGAQVRVRVGGRQALLGEVVVTLERTARVRLSQPGQTPDGIGLHVGDVIAVPYPELEVE